MADPDRTPLLVVLGPTASGKSALGLRLAAALGGEIVSADAMQVYRGLDIGTAKPSAEQRAAVPHHLLDRFEPHQRCSAGDWARLARRAIAEIRARGRTPLVVGGTGLYLRALLQGLAPVPPRPPRLRERLERLAARRDPRRLHRWLAALDPEQAARLAPTDRQRILRALEVRYATGRSLGAWVAQAPFGGDVLPALKLGLRLPRAALYARIEARVEAQLAAGWVEEVRGLVRGGVSEQAHAMKALGYRTLLRHLSGSIDLESARALIQRDTRRFAKRQLTWFKRETGVIWFDALDPLCYDRVLACLGLETS
ncbi:MAG TPA: tRNA (adenosine(37)-N6)-dimethylallyltransferase MiaA [Acidobacteriota bacterium]